MSNTSSLSEPESPLLTESIENFNGQTPERVKLLAALKSAMGSRDVDVHFWAMCQICDLKKLRKMVKHPTIASLNEYSPRAAILHCK